MVTTDLETCAAEVGSVESIEVDGVSARDLYETPAEIVDRVSPKIKAKTVAYSGCQACVWGQCVYSRS